MKRIRKVFCGFIFLFFGAFLVVLSRKNWNFARPYIHKFSGKFAGTAIDIRGNLYADFLTWSPVVTAENIHVRRKVGERWGVEALNVSKVYVQLHTDALLHRTIRVHKLQVDRINFNVPVWQQGNRSDNKESEKKSNHSDVKLFKFELVDGRFNDVNVTLPEAGPLETRKVHVAYVNLLVDAKSDVLTKLQGRFQLGQSIAHNWLVFVRNATVGDFPLALTASGGSTAGSFELATDLGWRDEVLRGKGKFKAEVRDWPEIFSLVDYHTADANPPVGSLESDFSWQGRAAQVSIAKAVFGRTDIQGDLQLDFPADGPVSLKGQLNSQETRYSDIGAFLPKSMVEELPISRSGAALKAVGTVKNKGAAQSKAIVANKIQKEAQQKLVAVKNQKSVPPNVTIGDKNQSESGNKLIAVKNQKTTEASGSQGNDADKKSEESSGVFSNTPISFAWSSKTNIDLRGNVVHFVGQGKAALIDAISFHVVARDGGISLEPLYFRSELGSVETRFNATPEGNSYRMNLQLDADKLEIGRLLLAYFPDEMKKVGLNDTKVREVFKGELAAAFALKSMGSSYKAALEHANGRLAVQMGEGKASSLIVEALGLDLVEIAGVLMARNQAVPVQCMSIGAEVHEGAMTFDPGMLSTSDSNVYLTGNLDFPKEELHVKFDTRPKDLSWGVLRSPLTLNGPLNNVKPGVEPISLIGRIGLAVSLGALVTPAAAAVPFLEPGTERRDDCPIVIRRRSASVAH